MPFFLIPIKEFFFFFMRDEEDSGISFFNNEEPNSLKTKKKQRKIILPKLSNIRENLSFSNILEGITKTGHPKTGNAFRLTLP